MSALHVYSCGAHTTAVLAVSGRVHLQAGSVSGAIYVDMPFTQLKINIQIHGPIGNVIANNLLQSTQTTRQRQTASELFVSDI